MAVTGILPVTKRNLNLKLMLEGGQCFRWRKSRENQWTGVASKILWVLTQHDDHVQYTAKSREKISPSSCHQFLTKYLRLGEDLDSLYDQWSKADKHFAKVSVENTGLRVLDQDPIENLFSFICSSNNNIVRISSMVEKMCKLYGEVVVEEDVVYFAFPPLERLASLGVEDDLRAAGFGYRAKYIHKSAEKLVALGGEKWLTGLSNTSYEAAKQQLMQLEGIGPKVADCICLMSLGHLCAVPVDTHVFQIAAEHYLPHLKATKSCTSKIYNEITNHFIQLYGPYAGWAHTILFCADLKMFKQQNGKARNTNKARKDPSKSSSKNVETGTAMACRKRSSDKITVNTQSHDKDENIAPSSSKVKARKVAVNVSVKEPTKARLPRACKK